MIPDDLAWDLARGSGLAAFVLLSASVAMGLALSLRAASPAWPRALVADQHRFLTALALLVTGVHVAMLLADPMSEISLVEAVVPFASDWRPLATGLGVVALQVAVLTWVTTAMRARMGAARWRRLHRLAIVAYAAALAHGLLAGSSAGEPWAIALYTAGGVMVGGLLVARVTGLGTAPPPEPPPPPPAAAAGLPPLAPRPRPGGRLPPLAP